MTWVRRTFWEPDNVDPGQLPLAIVCPDRNWGRVHAEIEAENPPYPVMLIRPMHRVAGLELRGYQFRHISPQEYTRQVQRWEVVELDPRVRRPAPTENHYDHAHFTIAVDPAVPENVIRFRHPDGREQDLVIADDLPDPSPTTEAMRERTNDWADRVVRENAERRERGLERLLLDHLEDRVFQEPGGILAAIDTSNVADSSDDELTEETLREAMREFRERYYDSNPPAWQTEIIQAMVEGRRIIVSRDRFVGTRELANVLEDIGFARSVTVTASPHLPDESAIAFNDDTDEMVVYSDTGIVWRSAREPREQDIVMASWFAQQGAVERIRELYANTPPESPAARMLQRHRQQVPDEITDADRERWANELETTPYQGDDSGQGVSSDELLEAIGEAVTEWKDVRDDD